MNIIKFPKNYKNSEKTEENSVFSEFKVKYKYDIGKKSDFLTVIAEDEEKAIKKAIYTLCINILNDGYYPVPDYSFYEVVAYDENREPIEQYYHFEVIK